MSKEKIGDDSHIDQTYTTNSNNKNHHNTENIHKYCNNNIININNFYTKYDNTAM